MAFLRFVPIAIVLTLAGCGSSDNVGAGNPPIQVEDPYAVPAVIDDSYIELVMNRMEDTKHEIAIDTIAAQKLTPFGEERLKAVYSGEALKIQLVQDPEDLVGLTTTNVRPVRHYVTEIMSASPTCVWFETAFESILPDTYGGRQIVMVRTPHELNFNPTPWTQTESIRLPAPRLDKPCG